jgi:hypothetical protein
VDQGQPIYSLEAGREVAVMPLGATSDNDVVDILPIVAVRAFTVQISNGRLYARQDGRGLVTNDYIVPVTDTHKLALHSRQKPRPDSENNQPE